MKQLFLPIFYFKIQNKTAKWAAIQVPTLLENHIPKFNEQVAVRISNRRTALDFFVVVALLFYVHGKHLRSCRDGQLT